MAAGDWKSFDNGDLHDPGGASDEPEPTTDVDVPSDSPPAGLALGGCQTTANRPNGPATAEMAIHDFGRSDTEPSRFGPLMSRLAPVFARFPSPMRGSARIHASIARAHDWPSHPTAMVQPMTSMSDPSTVPPRLASPTMPPKTSCRRSRPTEPHWPSRRIEVETTTSG